MLKSREIKRSHAYQYTTNKIKIKEIFEYGKIEKNSNFIVKKEEVKKKTEKINSLEDRYLLLIDQLIKENVFNIEELY